MITGKTLIELGYTPGPWFKEAIEKVNNLDLEGSGLKDFLDNLAPKPQKVLELLENPVDYQMNILPTNADELSNIESVKKTMDLIMRIPTVLKGSIMPDACPTGAQNIPVGAVVSTINSIHPGMHSSDVCCSVMTTNLGKVDPKEVLDHAFKTTQFGPGGRKEHGGWEDLLYDNKYLTDRILQNYFTRDYIEKAAKHLGTQGDGNHFLFVGISEKTGDTHIVTHHGSRGFGASVYKKGLHIAEKFRQKISPSTPKTNAWIPFDELEGQLYWDALQIIRDWTKLNHEVIHNKICDKLRLQYKDRYWNEHNFVFKEGNIFHHAKGSTPMKAEFVPDNHTGLRLIPLNMAQPVLVVSQGKSDFAPHGAGRDFSRSEHKKRNQNKTVEQIFKEETLGIDVRFWSGNIDISELPSAYKNAQNVIDQIEEFGLGKIEDKIQPYGCIMAGEFKKFY